ncbi:hypothetical protein [Ruminococcus sp. Marseille-P6503]|uniref:hypothetical protein n=1 Tax=Ruminococcus sp. Marseille-P6503 TaxID=2364796 RepID=UPI000F529D1F|nr:hypothetical protein [Ruminococcus sp. Marseille-P6503]
MKEKIVELLSQIGIATSNNGNIVNLDSINFIRLIVSLEQEFLITIEDEYFRIDYFLNIDSIVFIVEKHLQSKNKE